MEIVYSEVRQSFMCDVLTTAYESLLCLLHTTLLLENRPQDHSREIPFITCRVYIDAISQKAEGVSATT